MSVAEALGYLASMLVFITFYMKTMIPLRLVAMSSNVAFIGYGLAEHLYPVLALHLALLPLNVCRLSQARRTLKQIEHAHASGLDLAVLVPYMARSCLRQGDVVFRKGEYVDALYYIAEGRVSLIEAGVTAEKGNFIGEIGIMCSREEHIVTGVCETNCELLSLSGAKLRELCHEEPSLGFMLVCVMARGVVVNPPRAAAGFDERLVRVATERDRDAGSMPCEGRLQPECPAGRRGA